MGDQGPSFDRPAPEMIGIYRAMAPDRRIQIGLDMTDFVLARLSTHLTESLGFESDQVGPEIARRRSLAGG